MSKSGKYSSEQEGEISVSMVKFTMKGSDASIQKGLDTIKAALVQAGFAAPPMDLRQLRSSQKNAAPKSDEEEFEVLEEVTEDDEIEEDMVASHVRRPAAPRKAPNYKIIKDLIFDDVVPTLKDFCTQKDPKTDLQKHLCIAYWFKHYKDLPDLTIEHFFTAYMFMNWSLPTDPATPVKGLRNRKRQWFSGGANPGTSSINNVGEGKVREMDKAT